MYSDIPVPVAQASVTVAQPLSWSHSLCQYAFHHPILADELVVDDMTQDRSTPWAIQHPRRRSVSLMAFIGIGFSISLALQTAQLLVFIIGRVGDGLDVDFCHAFKPHGRPSVN